MHVSTHFRMLHACLQLHGTFAAQMYKLWGEEAEAALHWVNGMSSSSSHEYLYRDPVPEPTQRRYAAWIIEAKRATSAGRERNLGVSAMKGIH